MLAAIATLSPNAAILLLTLGIALIALELNRPGSVLPGALGLLLTLLAAAALVHRAAHPAALAPLALCMGVLLLQSRHPLPWGVAAAATLGLTTALVCLQNPGQSPVNLTTAILCGLFLGTGTTLLTRIARRARHNKALD